MQRRTSAARTTGVFHWRPEWTDLQALSRESSCHDRRRLSSALSPNRCPLPVPNSFASGCATFLPAARCFICVATVIAGSAIAAPVAAKSPPPPAPRSEPPPSAESRRPCRSPRPPARIPRPFESPLPSSAGERDGSIFPSTLSLCQCNRAFGRTRRDRFHAGSSASRSR